MPKPRDQEFECLGIPLKANVFATLQPRALSALCTDNPTKTGYWREGLKDENEASGCDLLVID